MALAVLAVSIAGVSPSPAIEDLLRTFAHCTGRLSAQLEHDWLMRAPGAGRTEATRDAMAEMLELVSGDATSGRALALRVDAKEAHRLLLSRATFNGDAEDAAWARRRSEREIAACSTLLLGNAAEQRQIDVIAGQ